MQCKRCSAVVAGTDLWCRSCGLWLASIRAVCDGDEMLDATGVCVVCGVPVCDTCGREHEGRTFCSDTTHTQLPVSHAKLEEYGSQFEADWVYRNLMNEGVAAMVFAWRDHPGYYGLTLPVEACVYIPKEDEDRTRELMDRYAEEQGVS